MLFYRIDPERVLTIPSYLLDILVGYLPALEASSMLDAITTVLFPHMEIDTRQDIIDNLNEIIEPLNPVFINDEPEQYTFEEVNPDKAAEFFKNMGIKTQERK